MEWQAFKDFGAVEILTAKEAQKVNPDRIFRRAARFVRTNRGTTAMPQAKSRLVLPGDDNGDPDAGISQEDSGLRTDSPTAPQPAIYSLLSLASRFKLRVKGFDVKNAYLSNKERKC